MKKVTLLIVCIVMACAATLHKDSRTTQVHSPFRWVFADSAARVAESVTTGDTDKVAYQKSDSSIWVLRDNSPKTWIELNNNFGDFFADSISTSRGINSPGGSFDSLKFGTAGWITSDSGSFPCTTTATGACHSGDGFGSPKDTVGVAYWYRFGKMITIYFEGFQFIVSGTSATNIEILNFPDSLVPNNSYNGVLDHSAIPVGNAGSGMCLILNGQSCNAVFFFHANSVRTYSITNLYATYTLSDVSSR